MKTLLQDCWEQIDEKLPFYAATSYPAEVRDFVTRSALGLSAIDADLAEANSALWRLLAEYEETIATGDLQLPLNGVSLLAYVCTSELVRSLTEVAVDVGFEAYPDYEPSWQAIEPGILWLLRVDDLHTLAELEDFLKQATPRARDTLAELARLTSDRGLHPVGDARDRHRMALAGPAPRRPRNDFVPEVPRRTRGCTQYSHRQPGSTRQA